MPGPNRSFHIPHIVAACALAGLLVGACASTDRAGGDSGDGAATMVAVTVSDSGCRPTTLAAAAGVVRIAVTNGGGDAGELEILSGVNVIAEVENIVPGFVVNLSARLDGGSYELICYAKRSPRGTLNVTGGAAPTARPASAVDPARLDAAVRTYERYVRTQADDLVARVTAFTGAIESGDVAGARRQYAAARLPWERIEPVAELFSDLDARIDFREEDFAGGVSDPDFRGFHRLEKGLFADNSADGLAAIAAGLRTDATELRSRLATLRIEPSVMARGAGELIEEVAQSKMTGEEDRYSKTDLWTIDANIDGSHEIYDLLKPLLGDANAALVGRLDGAYARVEGLVNGYADGSGGFRPFSEVSSADLKALQAALATLSEALAEAPGALGLDV